MKLCIFNDNLCKGIKNLINIKGSFIHSNSDGPDIQPDTTFLDKYSAGYPTLDIQ